MHGFQLSPKVSSAAVVLSPPALYRAADRVEADIEPSASHGAATIQIPLGKVTITTSQDWRNPAVHTCASPSDRLPFCYWQNKDCHRLSEGVLPCPPCTSVVHVYLPRTHIHLTLFRCEAASYTILCVLCVSKTLSLVRCSWGLYLQNVMGSVLSDGPVACCLL